MALPPHLAELEGRLASRVDEALAGFRRAFESRLREATERLLAEATDVPQPAFDGVLAEVERAALDDAPRLEGAQAAVGRLVAAARAFDRATTQADVLAALVEAGRGAAERLALLLVRDERLIVFATAGCDGRLARGEEFAYEGALREQLDAARGCLTLAGDDGAEVALRLGLSGGGGAAVVPLVLRDRIAALLWSDRATGAPDLASLQLLATLAAQRLELQALSSRSYTPTLYDGAEAPGEPLALWSALAVPAPAAPAPVAPAPFEAEAAPPFEVVPDESEAPAEPPTWSAGEGPLDAAPTLAPDYRAGFEMEAEPAPPPRAEPVEASGAPEPTGAPETVWTGEAVEVEAASESVVELFEAAPETLEPAEAPADDTPGLSWQEEGEPPAAVENDETGASVESRAAEVEAPALPEPPPAAPPPWAEAGGDVLRTVRMPILNFPLAGAERAPEETTAPVRVEEVAPAPAAPVAAGSAASTHEFPSLEPSAPPSVAPRLTVPLAPIEPPAPAPPPTTVPAEDAMDRTASRLRSTEVAPPPDLQGPGRAFLAGRTQRQAADPPMHEEAKRLARLLISEIKLYNEEQVVEGRRNRDLYHRLKEDIDRSRQIYDERVDPSVRQASDYFQQELVRSLAGGDPRALGI